VKFISEGEMPGKHFGFGGGKIEDKLKNGLYISSSQTDMTIHCSIGC
jgi:hypothetical protein